MSCTFYRECFKKPTTWACFTPLFLLLFCVVVSDIDSMHFVTFLLLDVKLLQLKIDLCYSNRAG